MKGICFKFAAVFSSVLYLSISALAQVSVQGDFTQTEMVGKPYKLARPVIETVAQIMRRPQSIPKYPSVTKEEESDESPTYFGAANPASPAVGSWPAVPKTGGGSDQFRYNFTPKVSFQGGSSSESGFVPPDVEGAVGPTQVLMCVNGRIKVFDRNGNVGALNTTTNTFFNSVRNNSSTSDPRVRFDRTSNRWFVVMINVSRPNRVLLAVSSGPTITSQSSFAFYYFQQDLVTPGGNTSQLFDYPSLGVDNKGLYIGGNMFTTTSYTGSAVFVVNKASLIAAASGSNVQATATAFRGIGVYTPMGVDNDDPVATGGYVIGTSTSGTGGVLLLRRIAGADTAAPTLSSTVTITVPSTASPSAQPTLGTTGSLDSLDHRLFGAHLKTNRNNGGAQSIWTSHAIRVNAGGVGTSTGDRNGARWYQVQVTPTTASLVQAGTLFSPNTGEGRWIDSITSNGQGHALLGANAASANRRVAVVAAFRHFNDPLGTLQPEQDIIQSVANYNAQGSGNQRWGDYSHMWVDPNDDMTMWGFQEYCDAANSWAVRIFSVQAPPPATIANVSPSLVSPGSTVNVTVNGTVVNGSGFFDPGPTFPNRLAASFGAGVTVNSITYVNPTTFTANITVATNAATGARNLTVTNPDGQSTSASGVLQIGATESTITANALEVPRGVLVTGGLGSVQTSDDIKALFQNSASRTGSRNPTEIIVRGISPVGTASQLKLRLESSTASVNIRQTVEMFNYQTNAWEEIDVRPSTTEDTLIEIPITTNASRFINSSTGQVQARVTFTPVGTIDQWPYSTWIDLLEWVVTP